MYQLCFSFMRATDEETRKVIFKNYEKQKVWEHRVKYRVHDKEPSNMFIDTLTGVGGPSMDCTFCGRTHHCIDSVDVDSDEREYMLQSKKDNPEAVVIHDYYDCIEAKEFCGNIFVLDCPCNGLELFENVIRNEAHAIKSFIEQVQKQEKFEEECSKIENILKAPYETYRKSSR
jgi:hypothetical protein